MRALAFCAAFALAGCAAPLRCAPGLSERAVVHLYFGRDIAAGAGVSEAQWAAFVDGEVTARFPDGFSVSDAQGQWRGADGAIIRERSKVVTLVLSGAPQEQARIEAIRAAYKARFNQESVLATQSRVCAGF